MRRFLPMSLVLLLTAAIPAGAHEESAHVPAAAASPIVAPSPPPPSPSPFPLGLDTDFALIDSQGRAVTADDFAGRYLFVFFGFARCRGICPTAFAAMGEASEILAEEGGRLQPLLITVDPENEPPRVLAEALPKLHPRLEGLTGSEEAVAQAMRGFQIEAVYKGHDALNDAPIFAHGSYIYLLGPKGELLSVLPPVLGAERLARIARGYISRPEG